MPRRRGHASDENGRSIADGKAGNGTYQATSKHLSDSERGVSRAGESPGPTFSNVKYQCPKVKLSGGLGGKQTVSDDMVTNTYTPLFDKSLV